MLSVAQGTQCLMAERRDLNPGPPVQYFSSNPRWFVLTDSYWRFGGARYFHLQGLSNNTSSILLNCSEPEYGGAKAHGVMYQTTEVLGQPDS